MQNEEEAPVVNEFVSAFYWKAEGVPRLHFALNN